MTSAWKLGCFTFAILAVAFPANASSRLVPLLGGKPAFTLVQSAPTQALPYAQMMQLLQQLEQGQQSSTQQQRYQQQLQQQARQREQQQYQQQQKQPQLGYQAPSQAPQSARGQSSQSSAYQPDSTPMPPSQQSMPTRGQSSQSSAYQPDSTPMPPSQQSMTTQQASPKSSGITEDQLRLMLLQRSLQFGGIFRPAMDDWMKSPSAPSSGSDRCGQNYSDYGAQQACRAGDGWAADRLQSKEESPSEHDWYNR